MKLRELLEVYKGEAIVDVKDADDNGDLISVANFTLDNIHSIKGNIMDSEIAKFQAGKPDSTGLSKLSIILKEIASEIQDPDDGDKTDSTITPTVESYS